MLLEELISDETEIAATQGVRKDDAIVQLLRCEQCGATQPWRQAIENGIFDSLRDVWAVLGKATRRSVRTTCRQCGQEELNGDGPLAALLIYAEHRAAHLAFVLQGSTLQPGSRQLLIAHQSGRIEPIEASEELRNSFLRESALRRALQEEALLDAAELRQQFAGDDVPEELSALAFRAFGEAWLETDQRGAALLCYETSLQYHTNQPQVLQASAELIEESGDFAEACDRLQLAYQLSQREELLAPLIRVAYRLRRHGLLRRACEQALEQEREPLLALKGLVCCGAADRPLPLRRSFGDLASAAAVAGERSTETTAQYWQRGLAIALTEWQPFERSRDYARRLSGALQREGFTVEVGQRLGEGPGALKIPMLISTGEGSGYALLLNDAVPRLHVVRTIRATLRALYEHEDLKDWSPIVLSSQPLPWYVYRMCSPAPDARLEVQMSADTTLHVHSENIADLLWAAERFFGASLDFTVESLGDVDRIIERYREEGLGELSYAFCALLASYLGEVLSRLFAGARWEDGDDSGDPRVLVLSNEVTINVMTRVRRAASFGGRHLLLPQTMRIIEELSA